MSIVENKDFEPTIYHRADVPGGPPDQAPDQPPPPDLMDIMKIREEEGRLSRTGVIDSFAGGLEKLHTARERYAVASRRLAGLVDANSKKDPNRPEEEKKKDERAEQRAQEAEQKAAEMERRSRAEMGERHQALMFKSISTSEFLYDTCVDRKRNAYPYYNGAGEGFFSFVLSTLDEFKDAEWMQEGTEEWLHLKRAYRDTLWAQAFFNATVGYTSSLPSYYDVVRQLRTLIAMRSYVTGEDMEKMFGKDVAGWEYTNDEIKMAKNLGIKLSIPERYDYGKFGDEALGFREMATKFQDESFRWRMMIAATAQYDWRKRHENASFMGSRLQEEERDFITYVLEKKTQDLKTGEVTVEVLNPYSSSSKSETQREIISTLEALLKTNAYQRLQEIIGNASLSSADKDKRIRELEDEVKTASKRKFFKWFFKERRDPADKLASVVTREGLLQDYSLMTAFRYCWGYKWKKTGRDRSKWEVSEVKTGGINTYAGDLWSLYWARRAHDYDLLSNSRTPFLPPTEHNTRVEMQKWPLGEMIRYEPDKIPHPDPFLREQYDLLFSDDPKWRDYRKSLGYSDLDPQVKEDLKRWAWVWRSPFNVRYAEGPEVGDYPLDYIFFMPPALETANFFDTARTGPREPTFMQQFISGKGLSDVDWKGIDIQQVDSWLVDCDMAARYMDVMINVFDKQRNEFWVLVATAPSTLGPKEAAKRLRLSHRKSPHAKPPSYEEALIPQFVTLAAASKFDISNPGAWQATTREDIQTGTYAVERFAEEMAYWKRALMWLPRSREPDTPDEVVDYNKSLGLLAEVHQAIVMRIAKSSAEEAQRLARTRYIVTTKRINQMKFMQYKGELNFTKLREDFPLKR